MSPSPEETAAKAVLLVGCGNIGSRALQALAKLEQPAIIYAVDPMPEALARARSRVAELGGAARARIVYAQALAEVPDRFDLALISTCADTRRPAIEALLQHARVRNLVLEKFLFQRREDYAAIGDLLARAGTRAWVNLVRRAWPGYRRLRERLGGEQRVEMLALGPDFRLASNAIHYIDVYAFLTGVHVTDYDVSGIEGVPIASKRAGFRELSGMLRGRGGAGSRITLASHLGSKLPFVIQFFTPRLHWIVRELERKAWCAGEETGWQWQEQEFESLDMSATTGVYAEILERGTSALPSYAELSLDHLALIDVYNRHWFGEAGAERACPIT